MAAAETARLIASLELQDRNFTRGIKQVERGVDRVDKKLSAVGGFVNRNLARALDTAALKIVQTVGTGLEELATLEDAETSVAGAISQVGKGWTITAADIATAANEIEAATDAAFDDKAIVAASETLIRYGKVSEKNLIPALEVMTDLAAKTGDVDSASTLLAKSLADPTKAAGKLARQGIILTKQQQKQIKAMVEAGDVAGAQTLIIETLAETTKGAAKASAGPYRDALNKLGDAGEDLRRTFVTGLAPAILEVADLLTTELAKPATINALKGLGSEIGSGLKSVISIAKSLPWDSIGNAMKLAGTGAKAILDAFLGLPPWVQTAVLTGWGLNKITGGALTNIFGTLASGLIKGVLGMNAGVVNINAGVVNGGGGLPGAVGKGGGGLLAGLGATGVLQVGIVALAPVAAIELTRALAGGTEEILRKDRIARERTAAARGVPEGNRAPAGRVPAQGLGGDWLKQWTARNSNIGRDTNASVRQEQNIIRKLNEQKADASRQTAAQKAELGNINNAIATQTNAQKAAAVAQAATTVLQGSLQAARDAMQRVSTTTAGTNAANASRSAGATTANAMSAAATRIVTAVYAARPIIRPTNIVERTTTIYRTGGTSGSRQAGYVPKPGL